MTRAMVAVSLPKHRTTANRFRASSEEAAMAMALELDGAVEIVHASQSKECSALGVYAGLGAELLVWLTSNDAVSALAEYASRRKIDIILTGTQALQGLGTGLLPYFLAQQLNWPILADVRRLAGSGGNWTIETGHRFGRRLTWNAVGPMVLTVSLEQNERLLSRYAEARHSHIRRLDCAMGAEQVINLVPATPRPAPLPACPSGPYESRLRTLLRAGTAQGHRQIVEADEEELGRVLVEEVRRQQAGEVGRFDSNTANSHHPRHHFSGTSAE